MKIKPLVTVIIPTHNCIEYLPRAIESVYQQKVGNIEIIVIDDSSTDGTWAWLCKESGKHPQLKPYRTSSLGPSGARNYALDRATGDYTAFLDADDYWLPGKLMSQLEFHRSNPTVTLSFTNYRHINLKGKDLGDCFGFWPSFSKKKSNSDHFSILSDATAAIYSENVIGTSCAMVVTRAMQDCGGFDKKMKSAEDWDMWLRLSQCGQVGYSNKTYMVYLMRPGSESSKVFTRLEYMKKILNKYRSKIAHQSIKHIFIAYGRLACGYAEYYLQQNKPVKALFPHILASFLTPSTRMFKATISNGVKIFTH